jgi:hypothetical protein
MTAPRRRSSILTGMAPTHRMTLANLFLATFWCAVAAGCNRPERGAVVEQPLAAVEVAELRVDFKAMVERPEVARQIAIAEQVLPTDERRIFPKLGPTNVSYADRVDAVASRLFHEAEPKFKNMTARALINSIYTYKGYDEPKGVAGRLYQFGNLAIMEEIALRPRHDLELLRPASDEMIYNGPNGEALFLKEFVEELINNK